jgi:ubiquinone/menaquinone biosynthesis C-methylase UbiE
MKCCNAYESEHMKNITGETLRPGGFVLTDKAVEFCKFSREDSIMDLGCGMGATLNYLHETYNIEAVGIDPSEKLIDLGRKNYEYANFIKGRGEQIPFENESFNGVFAECTLSLMENLNSVMEEVFRVIKSEGWFVVTDVYAKRPEFISELNGISVNSCMRSLHDLGLLRKTMMKIGFEIMLLEDCSQMLKALMVKTIFSYGSMSAFWNKAAKCSINGEKFQSLLKNCKPGYFIMIARKGGKFNE